MNFRLNKVSATVALLSVGVTSLVGAVKGDYLYTIYSSDPDTLEGGSGSKVADQYSGSLEIGDERMIFNLADNDRYIAGRVDLLSFEMGTITFEERSPGLYIGTTKITNEYNFGLAASILTMARIAVSSGRVKEAEFLEFSPPNKLKVVKEMAVNSDIEGIDHVKVHRFQSFYWRAKNPTLVIAMPGTDRTLQPVPEEEIRAILKIAEDKRLSRSQKLDAFIGILGEDCWVYTFELESSAKLKDTHNIDRHS